MGGRVDDISPLPRAVELVSPACDRPQGHREALQAGEGSPGDGVGSGSRGYSRNSSRCGIETLGPEQDRQEKGQNHIYPCCVAPDTPVILALAGAGVSSVPRSFAPRAQRIRPPHWGKARRSRGRIARRSRIHRRSCRSPTSPCTLKRSLRRASVVFSYWRETGSAEAAK